MLVTTCTHCLARFRVTPQQLNARQGQVRCGRCSKVFSGFEALERFPDDDTGSRLLAAREAQDRDPGAARAQEAASLPEVQAADEPPAAPEPPSRARADARAVSAPVQGEAAPPYAENAPPFEEAPPRARPSAAWAFGAAVLALVLVAELTYALRAPIAQRYPVTRPWLVLACERLACTVPWPHDERLLKLESSDLLEVPGQPNQISLAARIRNLARVPQAYPDLELTLTDVGGQAAARRVLRPADYLGRPPRPQDALPAGGGVAVRLRLETTGLKATGYELLLFYP